ncbi:MAG: LolA-like protein [Fimbriimonadaceae bacterium]
MTLLLVPLLIVGCSRAPSIDDYCQTGLRDVSFTATVVSGDQEALKKIGKDFGTSFKFSSAKVYIQEPFKLRIESDYEGSKVVMVENDLTTVYSIPGIRRVRDLTHSPGGRQTLLDFGVLAPSLFKSVFDASFVSASARDGTVTFDLTFKPSTSYKDTTRYRVVIDASKLYVERRDWFGQDGALRATFLYNAPKLVKGVWVPTDVSVRNGEGKFAGETRATDIRVNSGLDPKLFAVR